jgi:arylsulfatase
MQKILKQNYLRTRIIGLVLCISILGCSQNENNAKHKKPNILVIVVDDIGYTDLGVFGSEIGTPNIDKLANDGIKFANYYVAPTCSPTRAMLLSGIDNHLVGMGSMSGEQSENQKGQPGYEGYLNFRVAALPNILKDSNYHTYMTGKWHLGYEENNSPTARGFDRSFALLSGGAGHFNNMLPILGSKKAPYRDDGIIIDALPDDFYSTEFYTEKMLEYIDSNQADDKPFFGYLAYTAPHWPLQAPQSSIEKQQGNYDHGYDVIYQKRLEKLKELGLVDDDIPASKNMLDDIPWDDLSDEDKKRSSKLMEIYAAMVNDIDHNIGRLVTHLENIGELENTLIFFMSDNGAEGHPLDQSFADYGMASHLSSCCDNSYENMGQPDSYLWYGSEWARVSTGPWRRFKGFSSEGGIRAPAFIYFPKFNNGTVNTSYTHVKDIMPTLLDLLDIDHPMDIYKQRRILPMQGISILPVLLGDARNTHSENHIEGWELFGKTAIRKGNWKMIQEPKEDFFTWQTPLEDNYEWQLFNLSEDPSEFYDISGQHPEKMQEMLEAWDQYAKENGVIIPERVMGF